MNEFHGATDFRFTAFHQVRPWGKQEGDGLRLEGFQRPHAWHFLEGPLPLALQG